MTHSTEDLLKSPERWMRPGLGAKVMAGAAKELSDDLAYASTQVTALIPVTGDMALQYIVLALERVSNLWYAMEAWLEKYDDDLDADTELKVRRAFGVVNDRVADALDQAGCRAAAGTIRFGR